MKGETGRVRWPTGLWSQMTPVRLLADDPVIGRWNVADPLAEKYYSYSAYNYALNDPIGKLDPNGMWVTIPGGMSTNDPDEMAEFLAKIVDEIEVGKTKDGRYQVLNGRVNSDKNIYVVDSKGNRTGEVLGEMLTEYSFFNEDGTVIKNAMIDMFDYSGQIFFDRDILAGNSGLEYYMINATGGKYYDFKEHGATFNKKDAEGDYYLYRGMPFNKKVASARDIGNYAAGFVAGRKGLSWLEARIGFDALESYQNRSLTKEGAPSQKAQKQGHFNGIEIFRKQMIRYKK
ncbi:hypothetical protein [Sphingobacterium spiritivorum]|uniref:hypothetical protein n=1 Tax=Sphingobacterium spiritivorum TaxID=258 RepID=UPI0019180023|nr:hypothetical protein [Sphingobacterium spiritivorum]QQT26616.1 hypothetical protein I6J02_01785 [Sphingobacterium spiritivorum]